MGKVVEAESVKIKMSTDLVDVWINLFLIFDF